MDVDAKTEEKKDETKKETEGAKKDEAKTDEKKADEKVEETKDDIVEIIDEKEKNSHLNCGSPSRSQPI